MKFDDDYQFLRSHIAERIEKYKAPFEPNELLNDTYILYSYSYQEYDRDAFVKTINTVFGKAYNERRDLQLTQSFRGSRGIVSKVCSICKEDKPKSCFRILRNDKKNVEFLDSRCSECINKNSIKWQRDNKEKWNQYLKQRRKKIREKKGLPDRVNKLSSKQVAQIRRLAPKMKYKDIAPKFGVSIAMIGQINNGNYYKKKCSACKKNYPRKNDSYCRECRNEITRKHSKKYSQKRVAEYSRKQRETLGDYYVKEVLRRQGYKTEEMLPEIIELKREQLRLHRMMK